MRIHVNTLGGRENRFEFLRPLNGCDLDDSSKFVGLRFGGENISRDRNFNYRRLGINVLAAIKIKVVAPWTIAKGLS